MMIISQANQVHWVDSYKKDDLFIERKINILILFIGGMFVIKLLYEIDTHGGFDEWLFYKFTIRFDPTPRERDLIGTVINTIPWRSLFNALVFVAFLYRYKLNRQKLYGIILPLIGVVFAISTSHRGSILLFLIGLFFMEIVRIHIHKSQNYNSSFGTRRETSNKTRYYAFAFVIVSTFLMYGSMREAYVGAAFNQAPRENTSTVYKVLNQGSGIQGISSIMRRYGHDLDFLMGKTYFDMLLLPVPRFIYESKPEWYGIDDITTGTGWPSSTQSAVTMPGEAYANFGWFGLFIAGFYGVFFGLFLKYINTKGGIYTVLYAAVMLPMIFLSNWMAFTGIMNMFFAIFFLFGMLFLINNRLKFN